MVGTEVLPGAEAHRWEEAWSAWEADTEEQQQRWACRPALWVLVVCRPGPAGTAGLSQRIETELTNKVGLISYLAYFTFSLFLIVIINYRKSMRSNYVQLYHFHCN